ncbi:type 4a pilus biogenesis protein PilO [Alkalilimnicola sp. S0819]|uniref:type 4a pilus biogenesis protein PilO n=1 Tax=Alkalilimnicola sp. S0819 TaxID=2613922 RepID=UPI0012629D79|nr:type 4a pilus biogenesis protein PilO [Alkalilimnicola sp. S0819]KAB7624410.1 type 4a pilus biogenesis protein PilO [Alkalilimnicola sp. S0819]MPQ16239.1 type 4a pilus biogenesis protein PilO [Alkalilimnicola sp. S0819]
MDLNKINELDFNNIGSWPWPAKAVLLVLAFVAVVVAGWWFDWQHQQDDLKKVAAEEKELLQTLAFKQKRAANLEAYEQQLADMRRSFGDMLRQLPSRAEVSKLLVDISQTGLASGLEFDLFRPSGERLQEFYAELPVQISVRGDYHEFGRFVSGVANLPRIVTLHDIDIAPAGEQLVMNLTAKTYWYVEEGDAK